jgi:hypothetical protein
MAIKDIINKGACGLGEQKGFNVNKGCPIPFKDIDTLWVTPYDITFDGSVDLTEAYVKQVQQDGNLTILKNIVSFDAQNTEVQTSTTPRGYKEKAIEGIYEFKAMFNENIWFNALLGTLEGKRNKRVLMLSNGTIYGTEYKADGSFRGMGAYSIIRDLQTFTQGTDAASQGLMIQFEDHKELDDKPVVISPDVLEFDPAMIEPIVQTYIDFTVLPSTGGNSFAVSAVVDRGRKTSISSLDLSFLVSVNGSYETVTGVEGVNGYTLTFDTYTLSAGDLVKVSLDGVVDVDGDCLYTSNTASYQVVTLL